MKAPSEKIHWNKDWLYNKGNESLFKYCSRVEQLNIPRNGKDFLHELTASNRVDTGYNLPIYDRIRADNISLNYLYDLYCIDKIRFILVRQILNSDCTPKLNRTISDTVINALSNEKLEDLVELLIELRYRHLNIKKTILIADADLIIERAMARYQPWLYDKNLYFFRLPNEVTEQVSQIIAHEKNKQSSVTLSKDLLYKAGRETPEDYWKRVEQYNLDSHLKSFIARIHFCSYTPNIVEAILAGGIELDYLYDLYFEDKARFMIVRRLFMNKDIPSCTITQTNIAQLSNKNLDYFCGLDEHYIKRSNIKKIINEMIKENTERTQLLSGLVDEKDKQTYFSRLPIEIKEKVLKNLENFEFLKEPVKPY